MMNFIQSVGESSIRLMENFGNLSIMLIKTVRLIFLPPYRLRLVAKQMEELGVNSLPVVIITATFTGMVLALQSFSSFSRINAESLVASVVALSMTRELGPVITGLIVAGRAGSAMAAELGTMKVTEQIDALYALATDPIDYLIVPRFLAGLIMTPLLTIVADSVGIAGGYFVSVNMLGANPITYRRRTWELLVLNDVYSGVIKASVFGGIIAIVGCYEGFAARGGAEGVGRATTRAVVISSMLILISDYFLTALLF